MNLYWFDMIIFLTALAICLLLASPEITKRHYPKVRERHDRFFSGFIRIRYCFMRVSQYILGIFMVIVGSSYFIEQTDTIPLHDSEDLIYKVLSYLFILYWGYRMVRSDKKRKGGI